jgi:uncharacterized membrane protein YhaH (DUF805 family)
MNEKHTASDVCHVTKPGLVTLEIRKLSTYLWIATAIVLGLGVMREVVVHNIGTETFLKDLRHFALDLEYSLPAWYESLTMATASVLLATIAILARHHDPRNRWAWTLLAVIFILMSVDEVVSFHEVAIKPIRHAFNLSGVLYFSWVVLAAPMLVILTIIFIPFMLRLPRRTALRFTIAAILFVGGAFGLEFSGGHYVTIGGFDSLPYRIVSSCEESLEIIGMTLFVTSLFRHLAGVTPVLHVTIKDGT